MIRREYARTTNDPSAKLLALLVMVLGANLVRAEKPFVINEREIAEGERKHWAFLPLRRPEVPSTKRGFPANNPIDRFVNARLETDELEPLPRADRAVLLRRLRFGLTGLPPSPEERAAFLADTSPGAYDALVDRLLASPGYGERWAQHWLDLARFAETDGFEHDHVRPEAWRYRDWVIEALNRNVPYDEFVRLQLAGDEVAPDVKGTHLATGFLMSGPDMPDINLQTERRHVLLNEMTSTVGSVFLGLTLECAQCHDHKYDPISQADFYRFRALFENALPKLARNKQHPMTVREPGSDVGVSRFAIRGDFRKPGPAVKPALLRIANLSNTKVAFAPIESKSSRRRVALADWLVGKDNPLFSRVIVNRVWQHHFGRGLVSSPSDFGVVGEAPTHPELLDWLATELIRTGWDLKRLHRLIVSSEAYQRASRPTKATLRRWKSSVTFDPKNDLLARRSRVRLDGESIRDSMLAVAGRLVNHRGGPGVRPPLPRELVATLLKNQWKVSKNTIDHDRRSVYIFARRNLRYPIFEAFDRPDGNASCSCRSTSTTAPQALMLLNSTFSSSMARAVADDVRCSLEQRPARVRACFERILARPPSERELAWSLEFLEAQADRVEGGDAERAVLGDLCLALFNLNEFVYVD